ncbi:MAG TPA: glycoside hydrolase family 32 protein, partial [Gemmataceae bacterium]|nr:glycoside hydrolase family 32 protein [Gemmataceae bacterium]
IMWGWVRVKGEGWNGMLSLPRVLTMRRDGRLGMAGAPELQALRGEHHRVAHRTVKPDSPHILTEVHGDCLEVRVEFEPGDATSFGLMRQTPDGKNVPLASFDRTRKELRAGSAGGGFELLELEKTLTLDIFLDRSVMEVYANGRECLTSPLTLGSVDRLGFFALNGSAKIKSADVWRMKPAHKAGRSKG